MLLFAIGDVVGDVGCNKLSETLPAFKRFKGIDVCVANGENSAAGNGITPDSAESLFSCGVDVITTGNHVYRRKEIYDFLDERNDIVRPANYYSGNPGKGYTILDLGFCSIAVINLAGNAYLDNAENAFTCADRLLEETSKFKFRVVDFHAEATAEKRAMGFYLDGKVSAVFGTHTHVQTADAQVLPAGTGYITDLGMTGPIQSVLGITPSIAIQKFISNMPSRFMNSNTACSVNGCLFHLDDSTGLCKEAELIQLN